MNIIITDINGFPDPQKNLLLTSTKRGLELIKGREWRDRVGNTSFSENKGLSGGQILALLDDTLLTIKVKEFHALSNTIAYTFLRTLTTYVNDYYLGQYILLGVEGEAKTFATIMHESMHELGFVHKFWWDKGRTVPYGIQHITESCYLSAFKTGTDI